MILKWVGGKTQILDKVLDKFPSEIQGDYYEPFIGGGSVLFATIPRVKGRVYASDINPHLIEVYRKVQSDPEGLIKELDDLQGDVSEVTYYSRRNEFNARPTPALFIYLNKVCFRGLYREGPNGFNVPYGHPKTPPKLCDPQEVRRLSNLFQNVTFTCESYEGPLTRATPNDFVYTDPPYVPETETSFTGYVRGGFHHETFFETLKACRARWVMSNSDTALVRANFEHVTDVPARRAIHSKNPGSRTIEVLVTP